MGVRDPRAAAAAYVRIADRLVPGCIKGFYLVGSAALGEFVAGRSDLDFVAVVDDDADARTLRRLRLLHLVGGAETLARSRRGGTPNGFFVRAADVSLPVTTIEPIASHCGLQYMPGKAFDLNPVVWKVLAERGITIRGPEPSELGLDPQPEELRAWNQRNLQTYWTWWGRTVSAAGRHPGLGGLRYSAAWAVAWGTLGVPRLHFTIATGDVIGKRTAGEYALDTFDREWHAIVRRGLAWWHDDAAPGATGDDIRRAGRFVLEVVDAATRL